MKLKIDTWTRIRTAYSYRHEPEYLRMVAAYVWNALLWTGTVIVAGAALYGASQLFSILEDAGNRSAKAYSAGTEAPILDRTQLQAILNIFTERQTQYELLKTSPPTVADPSR
ncbi:MAG: hypothetical protein UY94_C0019G0019 [Parcubacteria group bacterium GW2011_GWA2_56_21]|uniref:Uncharacterized protein n=1 Tax=Candidatus Kaiserbacteria bacterium RIFCSPHIGHO2_02_FULL_55_20 TaxID=1798497 RepID=A0A1F6DYP0_9BACT|nr:MAG: hypothetical protein UY94_C0019G0019 [Parcubacteria group bacterium GW2011_GWA2_56_21]OGG66533.1 MAG: hypothetical protein A3D71_02870 [Candidatus Kaiserbacteria bacterium RIFCSPHIGHO2_02_FULL_55_20]